MRYVLGVTRKRTRAGANAEAPITGVAAGSLGTAANLDDTQVLRTEDLKAAAPDWLDEDVPAAAAVEPVARTESSAAADAPAVAESVVPAEPVVAPPPQPRARRSPGAASSAVSAWRRRSPPALAGVAALLVLLLIAGSGFLSQLDLGLGAGPAGPAASAGALTEAQPSPTAEPKEGGKEKCHGKGRGNSCNGD